MELRCNNCGERIHLDAAKTGQEIACPKCGVTLVLPSLRAPSSEGEPRPTQQTLKRIFEPIPRPVAYLAGVVLILIILSPFWIYLLQDRFERRTIVLSPDVGTNGIPEVPAGTNVTGPVLDVPASDSAVTLHQYRGVRLDAAREDLQRRFSLRLQNTRGMVPEIYEASKIGDIDQLTAHFYNNSLKEFFLWMRPQRAAPDAVEKELREEFGTPKEFSEQTNTTGAATIGGLPGTLGVAGARDEIESRLAGFPHRRYLAWEDAQDRVDATIYYSSLNPAQCVSMLVVHVSAAQWLEANRARLGAVAPPPTNLLERTNTPAPEVEPPKRLFP
jgi:hypothetical protein